MQHLLLRFQTLRTSLKTQVTAILRGQPNSLKKGHISPGYAFKTNTVKPEPKVHLEGDFCQTGAVSAAAWDSGHPLHPPPPTARPGAMGVYDSGSAPVMGQPLSRQCQHGRGAAGAGKGTLEMPQVCVFTTNLLSFQLNASQLIQQQGFL